MGERPRFEAEEFDYYSVEQMSDPYPVYEKIRSQCSVGHSRKHGGFAFAADYEAARAVLSDYKRFSSANGTGLPARAIKLFPVDLDPPEQSRFRRILHPHFTPEAAETRRLQVRDLANTLIDGFIARGTADLADDLVRPTLSRTLLPLLGIPLSDLPRFSVWVETMMRRRISDPKGAEAATALMYEYVLGIVHERRGLPGQPDVLQSLLTVPFEGQLLSSDVVARTLMIIVNGALDTTTVAILESLLYLSQHPDEADRLLSGRLDWKLAVNELLRCFCPVTVVGRTVKEDMELAGTKIRAGEFIMAMNGAANRDPAQFADADKCVLDRADNPHLSFGGGAHICPGRHIAQMEIEEILLAVLTRMPDFKPVDGFEPQYDIFQGRAMKHFPVVFGAGGGSGHPRI